MAPVDAIDFSASRFTADPAKTWVATKDSKTPDATFLQALGTRQNETCRQKNNASVVNSPRKGFDPRFLRLGRISKTMISSRSPENRFMIHGKATTETEIQNTEQGAMRSRMLVWNDTRLGGYSGPIFKDGTVFPVAFSESQEQLELDKTENFVYVSSKHLGKGSNNNNEIPSWVHPQLLEYLKSQPSQAGSTSCSSNSVPNQGPGIQRISLGTYTLDSGAKVKAVLSESVQNVEGECDGVAFKARERSLTVRSLDVPGKTIEDYCHGEFLLLVNQRVDENKTVRGSRHEVIDATVAAE